MHALDPSIQIVLSVGDIAFVGRRHADIGNAERHGALGERSIDGVLGGRSKSNPFVAESGFDAAVDHRFEYASVGFITHAMQQIAAGAHLLESHQVTAFVMYARQSVANELL